MVWGILFLKLTKLNSYLRLEVNKMLKAKTKAILALIMLFVATFAFAGVANASVEYEDRDTINETASSEQPDLLNVGSEVPVEVVTVKIDGDVIETGTGYRERLDRGQELKVKVRIQANEDVEDVNVMAILFGEERFLVSDATGNFDMDENDKESFNLELTLPDVFEADTYDLRIIVGAREGYTKSYNYPLRIDSKRHHVVIEDVYFSSNGGRVRPGRSLLPIIRLNNLGESDEEDVRVEVSVPGLNLYAVDFIDEIDEDDEVSSEELFLTVPASAEPGVYDFVVTVKYDELTRTVSDVQQVEVLGQASAGSDDDESPAGSDDEESSTKGKTVVTVGPESQDVVRGEGGAIYSISLTNEGSTSKSYTVGVSGVDLFAVAEISPSNLVVVEPSETETVYVYISAKEDATVGSHTFTVDIKSGEETLQQIPMNANVVEPTKSGWDGLKKGLEIGLIVLIIVLIILGLIIAFTRAKGSDDEEEDDEELSGQTYY